jgi:hypothetical protein
MPSTPQLVTGRLNVSYSVTETLAYGAAGASNFAQGTINPIISYNNGASAVAASINLHYEEYTNPITLTAASSQTFTLSSLTDDLGRNFSMAGGVRMLIVYVITRTAGDWLTLKPGATHGWTALVAGTTPDIVIWDFLAVGVGQTDGYAVTAGSNDQFTITNAGSHSITFGIGIGGCAS